MMVSPFMFEESNEECKKRKELAAFRTAKKLNLRLHHFLKDISKSTSLSANQKKQIRDQVLANL